MFRSQIKATTGPHLRLYARIRIISALLALNTLVISDSQAQRLSPSIKTPGRFLSATLYRDSLGTTHITLRGPYPGLERFAFVDDVANQDGSMHMTGSAREISNQNIQAQPATLSVSNKTALLFFSSRRTSRPTTARFKLTTTETTPIIEKIQVNRSRPNNKLCAASSTLQPKITEPPDLQAKSISKVHTKEVEVAVFYDSSFSPPWPKQDVPEYLTAVTYAANKLYLRRLGVVARIKQLLPTDLNTTDSNLTSDTLLELFRKQISPLRRTADLFHLFVSSVSDEQTAGLAYVGSACDARGGYAVGLSRSVGAALQPIVLAHELAHGLGASHDQPADSLMNPILTTANTHVTAIARQSVSQYTNQFRSCLAEPSEPKVSITASTNADSFESRVIVSRPRTGSCILALQAREVATKSKQPWTSLAKTGLLPLTSSDTSLRSFRGPIMALALAAPEGAEVRAVVRCEGKSSYSREIKLKIGRGINAVTTRDGSHSAMWDALKGSVTVE